MTDILIPLGKGSRHNNLELRYCLRSIEKHLSGVGNVWIVGDCPDFVRGVVHVPCQDNPNNWNRAHNIYRKIMVGIDAVKVSITETHYGSRNEPVILSDNFLFMNDDHFLLQDYKVDEFPNYHRGPVDLNMHKDNLPQLRQYVNTLHFYPCKCLDFGVHCPIIYNKKSFLEVAKTLPAKWPEYGYEIKTLIGNTKIFQQYCDDLKFREPLMKESIYRALEDRPWFSIGDRTLKSGDMKLVLEELYPLKSKWEV